ncbi:MAG: DUF3667 domain-containing protein [Proteobacteria bacterium]|nr:DUF3667 domain-containing protein [Pseudomonadota bacterium]
MSEPALVDKFSCANCGSAMTGSFCANCGQQDKEVRRPFLYFLQEMLRVVFDLDGRAYRTIFYLLTKPGFLTIEYFRGRRTSYTPPLRLFLIISIGFFLMVSVVTSLQSMQSALVEDSQKSEEATVTAEITAALEEAGIVADPEALNLTINGEETTVEDLEDLRQFISQIRLPFLSEQTNQNLNRVLLAQAEENFQEVIDDPQDFLLGSLEYITFFMLLMMPLLALIQRILFVFARHYYVEHLVLTMHNHAFLIFALFLTQVVSIVTDLEIPFLSAVFNFLSIALAIWIVVYLYLSLKNYFQRSHVLTTAIFLATSFIYSIALGMGIAVFAVLLFILA